MTELVIRNQNILDQLEYVRSTVMNANVEQYSEGHRFHPEDAQTEGESYLTKEWLDMHMADTEHKGFPIEHSSIPIEGIIDKDPKLKEVLDFSRVDFISNLGANSNAVFLYYPKDGFVGWHTNQNNSGLQFIFSYSEKGDGYFQYYDKKEKRIIKLEDEAGWNARYLHFGKKKVDHCWHSAYTRVPRITICVLFRWWDKPHLKDQIWDMGMDLASEIEEK